MNYERVSKSWTQEHVLKSIQDIPKQQDGPVPMEVDRVEKGYWKGKGKGKEKGKGGQYGGWEAGAWGFGRGQRRGRDGKGKGRDKGKLLSYWEDIFSGALLNFGRVFISESFHLVIPSPSTPSELPTYLKFNISIEYYKNIIV